MEDVNSFNLDKLSLPIFFCSLFQYSNMPGRLEGKIALVSGSTQGFGRGILDTFIREGARVLGIDLQAADGPVEGYTEQQAYQIRANVAEEQSWKRAVCYSTLYT